MGARHRQKRHRCRNTRPHWLYLHVSYTMSAHFPHMTLPRSSWILMRRQFGADLLQLPPGAAPSLLSMAARVQAWRSANCSSTTQPAASLASPHLHPLIRCTLPSLHNPLVRKPTSCSRLLYRSASTHIA